MNLIFQELWILYRFLFQLHIYKYKNEDHAKKEFINQHYIIYMADKILLDTETISIVICIYIIPQRNLKKLYDILYIYYANNEKIDLQ